MKKTCFFKDGYTIYLIGANYWPRNTGPLMWRKWRPFELRDELKQMKDLGMNVCRSFLYWPDFMPTPDKVNSEMLNRLSDFISLCGDVDLFTIPSFFVGHMSGEDWDVPWREGKNFYNDPWMLKQESLFVEEVVKKVKDSKAIIGWLLSNEITNYAGNSDSLYVNNWIKTLRDVIRKLDTERPISVGDGVFGREIYGKDNGFRLDEQKDLIDFIGPHIYLYDDDSIRHSNITSFIIKMCDYGKPVILEEFGCSNCYASTEHQADYYRITYHSAFLSGAVGTLCWCFSDFNLPYQRPYSHHVHELFFGVTRADGSVKEAGHEIRRFSKIMENIDINEIEIEKSGVLITVPSFYIKDYPYSHEDKDTMRKVLLQSYTLTKQAHINAYFLKESPLPDEIESEEEICIPKETKLLISPNIQKLTAPFWEAIYQYVEQGGIFYCSFHSDMWIHIFEKLFGAKHNLRYGLPDITDEAEIEVEFMSDFFDISKGEKFTYKRKGNPRDTAFCPVRTTKAEILAVDKEGRPAIILNSIGRGKVIFSTYPLEYYLAITNNVHKKDETYRIYKSLSKMAGIKPIFDTDNPFVELGIVKHQKKKKFLLWVINHSWERATGFIKTYFNIKNVTDFETGESIPFKEIIPFNLDKKEVKVYNIEVKGGKKLKQPYSMSLEV